MYLWQARAPASQNLKPQTPDMLCTCTSGGAPASASSCVACSSSRAAPWKVRMVRWPSGVIRQRDTAVGAPLQLSWGAGVGRGGGAGEGAVGAPLQLSWGQWGLGGGT